MWPEEPELQIGAIAIIVLAIASLSLAAHSLSRGWRGRRYYKKGLQLCDAGKHAEALKVFLAAEHLWSLNLTRQSPDSHAEDLARLKSILDNIHKMAQQTDDTADISELIETVSQMQEMCGQRENFRIDGRMMKSEAVQEWARLMGELEEGRRKLRQSMDV
jgi:hypothetical protein